MSTGFSFGAKSTTSAPAFGSTTLTFGTPTTQPQTGGLSFGVSAPGAAPSSFGTPAAAPTTTSSLFGTSTAAPSLFGAPTATTAAPTLSFGLTPATTSSTGLTTTGLFGAPASSSAATPSFGLGGTTATTALGTTTSSSVPSFGFGLASTSAPSTTAPPSFSLGGVTSTSLAPATTTASASVGLGGISTSSSAKNASTTQKELPPKDQALPNEILQTVESFKSMVKQQKSHSSDISRCSVREFRRVEQEIDQLSNKLNEVENQLWKNRHMAEKLKYDTANTVQSVEMAQRTHDTPPGLQYENTAPLKFFLDLADQFERDMQNLKMQIEAADKYVKNHKNPDLLTPHDLATGMRRLHEIFVALAGQLQTVHNQVEAQKESFLKIMKHLLHDTSNPFDKLTDAPGFQASSLHNFIHSLPKVATGPTPFNNWAFRSVRAETPQQYNTPPPAYSVFGTNTGTGFGSTVFGTPMATSQPQTTLFGSTGFGQSSLDSSVQMRKSPTGNKRGKV